MRIAVVGAGISGILSAHLLQQKHEVTLFEKNQNLGGHTHTVVIESGPDRGLPVDTGFIVFNQRTYPNFIKFLDQLKVPFAQTDMSFGYYSRRSGQTFASRDLNTLFARRSNLFRPHYWRFLRGMKRFLETVRDDYLNHRLADMTLERYLEANGFGGNVASWFVVPMAAAIWSASDAQIMQFPVRAFAQFYENHGLLALKDHPPWYFVRGGSHAYVRAFEERFQGRIHTGRSVAAIQRQDKGVMLRLDDGQELVFDSAVLATHADEALKLLEEPTIEEHRLLSPWRYSKNHTVLHTDASFMPPNRRAWASWNYVRETENDPHRPITVTYHMNRLQRLEASADYFVTLNPERPIADAHVIKKIDYTHPIYDDASFSTQADLDSLNGARRTHFCGSYFGYGFHEDGARSAVEVAGQLQCEL